MTIIIIEKRRKIGEVDGTDFFVWEFFEVMKESKIVKWCADRGFYLPVTYTIIYYLNKDYRISKKEVQ